MRLIIRYWQRIWSEEWVLRGISLILAAILWHFVGGEDTVNKSIMVPVEVINMPRDLVISNQFKKEIEVTISGPRSQILGIDKGSIRRQVDLAQATPGTLVVKNTNESLRVPRNVTVLRMQPASIILSLDKLIHKQFDINPVTTGNLAKDYLLKALNMEPETITITGPQTVLSQIDVLRTKVIDISGLRKSTQLQVPLDLDVAIVDLIGETSITADIEVEVETVQRTITNLPLVVLVEGVVQRVSPDRVSLVLGLPKPLMQQKIDLEKLFKVTAIFDKDNRQKMLVQAIPATDLYEGVQVLRIEPQYVTLIEQAVSKEQAPGQQEQETKKVQVQE